MVFAEPANGSVVAVAERGSPRFAHAGDDGDRRPFQAAARELRRIRVLQDTEEAKLLPAGAAGADLVVATHWCVHRLPLPAARERGWRRISDCVEHREQVRGDLRWDRGKELRRGYRSGIGPVVDDVPRPRTRL